MGLIIGVEALDNRKLFQTVEGLHARVMEYLLEYSRQVDEEYTDIDPELNEAEVLAALESVLPRQGLLYWMDLPRAEKVMQVEELADVVMGIRVFNKCMGAGGEKLTLPYAKFETESDELRKKLQEYIKLVDSRVENCILGIRAYIEEFGAEHIFIVRLKDELTYHMQAAVYLQSLDRFVAERVSEVHDLSEKCAQCVNKICVIIGSRKCIPAELVYPELALLGVYQRNTLEEYNLLLAHSEAAIPLFALVDKPEFVLAPMGSRRLQIKAKNFYFLPRGTSTVSRIDSILEIGAKQRATLVDDQEVEKLKPNLEYGGFCVVSLVRRHGLLMRGDPKIGLVQVGDRVFSFADEDCICRFLKAPTAYLQSTNDIILKMPQLVHILGLHYTPTCSYLSIPKILLTIRESLPSDFGVQTCTHGIRAHRWDEETLEKRVQELKKVKTDSSQTKESHFHRHCDSQIWPPKDKWTQTGCHRGTTMALHARVLHNLRGDLHEVPKIVQCTFDVTETVIAQ